MNIGIGLVVLITVITAIVFAAIGYFVRKSIAEGKIGSAEQEAKNILSEAEKQAQATKREKIVEAKEEVHKLRKDLEVESRERRAEFQRMERQIGRASCRERV